MPESESEIAQSCPTLSDRMECSLESPRSVGFSRQVYWSGEPLSWVLSRLLEPGDVSALLQVPDALIVILFWAKAMVTVAKS